MSLHWAVRAGAEEPGPEGASLWDERGQSAQDLDSPAGAGDARRAGGRRASPQQRGDGEEVPWEGQARGETCERHRAAGPAPLPGRLTELKKVVEVAPSQGQQHTSDRGHRAGTGSPRKPTAALPTQSGREGRLPRGGTGHSGQGRVLGRVRATGRRSGNRTGGVHRPRQGRTGGRWQKAEGSVTVSELTHGLLPSTPGVKNEVGREARKRFLLNGNAGVRFGTWSQDAADSSETRAAEEGSRALPGAQSTRVKRRAGCAQRA